jgi:hypothetical protein
MSRRELRSRHQDASGSIPGGSTAAADPAGRPYISEFSPSGKLLFNAELPAGIATYRAYRLPWTPGV